MARRAVALAAMLVASSARAEVEDSPPPRRWHGSISAGGSLLVAGDGGDSTRFDASVSIQPWRKLGAVFAVRAIDEEPRSMMVMAGVEYQAGASRPRLVLSLYADVGIETAGRDAVVGGGIRTTLIVLGPLGIVADTGVHLIADPDDARVVIGTALMIAIAR